MKTVYGKEYQRFYKLARKQLDLPNQFSQHEEREVTKVELATERRQIKALIASKEPKRCVITMEEYLQSIKDPSIMDCEHKRDN